MLDVDPAAPETLSVVLGDPNIAIVDRWAEAQRNDLAEMEAVLARLRAEQAAMERLQDDDREASEFPPPALLSLIDRMLEAARTKFDRSTQEAHRGASESVATAIREAAAVLSSVGIEPVGALRRIDPSVPELPPARRPRSASALAEDCRSEHPTIADSAASLPDQVSDTEFDLAFQRFWQAAEPNRRPPVPPRSEKSVHVSVA